MTRRGWWDYLTGRCASGRLAGLMETAYLLRSPKNAERLLSALARAQRKEGTPQTVGELRAEVGLDEITPIYEVEGRNQ